MLLLAEPNLCLSPVSLQRSQLVWGGRQQEMENSLPLQPQREGSCTEVANGLFLRGGVALGIVSNTHVVLANLLNLVQ